MKKKLIAILVALLCGIFAFAGCGDNKDTKDANSQYYADGEEPVYEESDRNNPKYYDADGNYIGGYEEPVVDNSKYYDADGNYIGEPDTKAE